MEYVVTFTKSYIVTANIEEQAVREARKQHMGDYDAIEVEEGEDGND